jgi:NADH dehydrogenase
LDRIDPARDVRIRLIEAAPRILPALPERISAATMKLLEDLGVEVLAGRRVAEVRADGVVLADGAVIPGELVVWAAGVKGPAVLRNIGGLETTPNDQLVVLPTLQTTRDPDIFALGDCAACPRPDGKGNLPPRAQAAHQQATHLYRQIDRKLRGLEVEPFAYRDFGSLVSLGKYSTVGSLMGFLVGRSMFIEGYFARMMYRSLYKMHQTALHGHAPVLWRTLVGMVADRGQPQVKLH